MNPFGQLEVVTFDPSSPRECGREHGETLRASVHRMGELRMELMLNETDFKTKAEVIELARDHLPLLKAFDESLYEELIGIAEGADVSPETVVVINHYTDMRDIRKPSAVSDLGGCSVLFVPTVNGPLLGQTWDVHGSAMEHVFIMRFPDSIVFSVAGCLGMTGMNNRGVGVTINNLSSIDAKLGVVWPALVRKVLRGQSAAEGKDVIMNAQLGSGHHYVIADKTDFFAIETSGSKKKITQSSSRLPHIHTNHCLDDEMRKTHTVRETSTTLQRFDGLQAILSDASLKSTQDIYEAFGRVSIPLNRSEMQQTATCGAFVMDLKNGKALASKGPPSVKYFHNPSLPLSLEMRR